MLFTIVLFVEIMVITALIIIITCTVAFTMVTTVTIVAVSTVILSMSPTTAPIRRVLAAGLLDQALGFFPFEPGVHPFICDELSERPRRYLGQVYWVIQLSGKIGACAEFESTGCRAMTIKRSALPRSMPSPSTNRVKLPLLPLQPLSAALASISFFAPEILLTLLRVKSGAQYSNHAATE